MKSPPHRLDLDRIDTPIGDLLVVTDGPVLCAADFEDGTTRVPDLLRIRFGEVDLRPGRAPDVVRDAFARYFDGAMTAFDALDLRTGGTAFQERVWAALRTLRPGERLAYSALARRIGKPRAVRAVGAANGRNPISVVIPCHRLVGKDGSLTGYAGGLARKAWLLEHERQAVGADTA